MSKTIGHQVDGEIVTLEIPTAVINQWEGKEEFKTFYESFLTRHHPAKTLKGSKGGGNKNKDSKQLIVPKIAGKRRRIEDISDCFVDPSKLQEPEAAEDILGSVPIINARAGKKLNTMPTLEIWNNVGAFIRNDSGHEVSWLWFQVSIFI